MDRRYQVFVSSTFVDLESARAEVSKALLKCDCFPAGMELFPAADEEQFDYIKRIIDESDYYVVISAGKYGSTHPETGMSYTEMEYDYGLACGKPTIRLVHKDPFSLLKGSQIEDTDQGKEKLKAFRNKLQKSKLVHQWSDPKELGQSVVLALLEMRKTHPAVGWVRGDHAVTLDMLEELNELRKKSAENSSAKKQSEVVVDFDELKKFTKFVEVGCDVSDQSDKIQYNTINIKNSKVAEAVFIALLDNGVYRHVADRTSELLSENHTFSAEASKREYRWLTWDWAELEPFLHYLEARNLLSTRNASSPLVDTQYLLTSRGRQHAAFISSIGKIA